MVLPPQAGSQTHRDVHDPFLDGSDDHPILHSWRTSTPFLADLAPLVALGLALLLLGAFLHQLWATTAAADGLAKTASWFGWLGRAGIGGGLVFASLRPSPATPAIRVALLAIGVVVLLGLAGSGSSLLSV